MRHSGFLDWLVTRNHFHPTPSIFLTSQKNQYLFSHFLWNPTFLFFVTIPPPPLKKSTIFLFSNYDASPKGFQRVFQGCFKDVLRLFQWCSKGFCGCFKGVSRVSPGCLDVVLYSLESVKLKTWFFCSKDAFYIRVLAADFFLRKFKS